MGPGGGVTVIILWLLTASAIVGVALFWHRLGQRSLVGLAVRLLAQVLVVIMAIAAAGATLNRQYGFYASWSDLASDLTGSASVAVGKTSVAGANPAPLSPIKRQSAADLEAAARYAGERAKTERSLHLEGAPGPKGQFLRITVPGLTGLPQGPRLGRVIVWLPASYTDARQSHRIYPVIEGFHGQPGGPLDWERVDHVQEVLATEIADHKLAESVVVFPDYQPSAIDTECVNGGGVNMETWLTSTVPDWIVRHFRVRTSADSWAAMGYSAGGWCAAMAGLLHPRRYAASIVIGGYFTPEFSNWNPFRRGAVPTRYDLLRLARQSPPRTNLWVQVATDDPESGADTKQLVRDARAPLSVTTFDQPNVGHRIAVFMAALPFGLTWLGTTLPNFRGGPVGSSATSKPSMSGDASGSGTRG